MSLPTEAKRQVWRNQLKAATSSGDPDLLRKAIHDFESHNVPDSDGRLAAAKRMLDFLRISQGTQIQLLKSVLVLLKVTAVKALNFVYESFL